MKKLVRKLWLYYKYPNQFWADYHTFLNKPKAKSLGINFLAPNYCYFGRFNNESVIIDVGCGFLAEFSIHLIEKYGLKAYAVDPTKKHAEQLKAIEKKYANNFIHIPVAISKTNGKIIFNETLENESGSVMDEHVNVLRDSTRQYEVDTKNIKSLLRYLSLTNVDFLKLDIEGAEFELLDSINKEDLKPFNQIFIEFHHVQMEGFTKRDTRRLVKKINNFGFKVFSLDQVNFLFYK